MPITIDETYRSREGTEGTQPTAELRYVIQGTNDDTTVRALLLATSPQTYLGLRRADVNFSPVGGDVWECSAQYDVRNESQFTFDTGGGSQHITQSRATINRYAAPGGVAPNYFGAIGVADDQVAGTDVTVPVYQFSETHYIDDALVDQAYKLQLFQLTGRVNGSEFRGFAKGELLFLGASGAKRGLEDWEITYRFAASPNASQLTIGAINGIAKEGWHYLWIRYEDVVDSAASVLIKRPTAVYVEQVYQYGDFTLLGIGG